MSTVQVLTENVISQLRSSFNISNVTQCVTELVLNSLDAKSTAIAIRINLTSFKIQVIDNGSGISESNLKLIGLKYMTNKCHDLRDLHKRSKYYGFRGEALSSICELSKSVTIITKCEHSNRTFSKILQNVTNTKIEEVKNRPSCGTTITIEGFFHNLPVRQQCIKQFELENIKKNLENLIIIHPRVSFSLRNDLSGKLILNSPKHSDVAAAFKCVHPQININNFVLMKVKKNKTSVEGLLQKDLHENKKLQYVYVNKRSIFCQDIQKIISNTYSNKLKTSNGDKKYPIYVIVIKCPLSEVDFLSNPAKNVVQFKNFDTISRCLKKMISSFLQSGDSDLQEANKTTENANKSQFGLSLINGAVKSFAYKRKSDEQNKICEKIRKIDEKVVKPLDISVTNRKSTKKTTNLGKNKKKRNDLIGGNREKVKNKNKSEVRAFEIKDQFGEFTKKTAQFVIENDKSGNCTKLSDSKTKSKDGSIIIEKCEVRKNKMGGFVDKFIKTTQCEEINSQKVINKLPFNDESKKLKENAQNKKCKIAKNANKSSDLFSNDFVETTHSIVDYSEDNLVFNNLNNEKSEVRENKMNDFVDNFIKMSQNSSENTKSHKNNNIFGNNFTKLKKKLTKKKSQVREHKMSKLVDNLKKKSPDLSQNAESIQNNELFPSNFQKPKKKLPNKNKSEVMVSKISESLFSRSLFTENPENEDKGKDLIMDMFIKSLQVYPNENLNFDCEEIEKSTPPPKQKSDILSNFSFTSVTEKRKSKEKFIANFKKVSKGVQTSLIKSSISNKSEHKTDEEAQMVSKCVQTNICDNEPPIKYKLSLKKKQEKVENDKNSNNFIESDCEPTKRKSLKNFISNYDCDFSNLVNHDLTSFGFNVEKFRNNFEGNIPLYSCDKSRYFDFGLINNDTIINYNSKNIYENNSKMLGLNRNNLTSLENVRLSPIYNLAADSNFYYQYIDNYPQLHETPFYLNELNGRKQTQNHFLWNNFNKPDTNPYKNEPKSVLLDSLSEEKNKKVNPKKLWETYLEKKQIFEKIVMTPSHKFAKTNINKKDIGNVSRFFTPQIKSTNKINDSLKLDDNKIENNKIAETETNEIQTSESVSKPTNAALVELETNENNLITQSSNYCAQDWIKETNNFGKVYYVNKRTGMISTESPKRDVKFELLKRYEFLPKGLSPILVNKAKIDQSLCSVDKENLQNAILESYENELLYIKWRNYINCREDAQRFFEELYAERAKLLNEDEIPNVNKCALPKYVAKTMDNMSFTKNLFDNLLVIGQVDHKFIAVFNRTLNLLLLFDQHAVHERIRLELLLEGYKNTSMKLDQKLTIFLPHVDLNLLKNRDSYLKSLGIIVDFFTNGITIHQLPMCICNKSKNNGNLIILSEILIKEIIETLKSNEGIIVNLPRTIQNIINMEACRGAIKFGDKLTREECQTHLMNLSQCNLPFQCAHGRPTLTSLINFSANPTSKNVPKLRNLLK